MTVYGACAFHGRRLPSAGLVISSVSEDAEAEAAACSTKAKQAAQLAASDSATPLAVMKRDSRRPDAPHRAPRRRPANVAARRTGRGLSPAAGLRGAALRPR